MRARFSQNRKRAVAAITAAVILVALSVVYFATRGENIPFETIEQLDSPSSLRRWQDTKPTLFVVAQLADVETVRPFISDDAALVLDGLDYESEFVIAAFQGLQMVDHTGTFHIRNVARDGTEIRLYAHPDASKPDQIVMNVETSPYHLIKISNQDIDNGNYTFELFWERGFIELFQLDADSAVASISYSFP